MNIIKRMIRGARHAAIGCRQEQSEFTTFCNERHVSLHDAAREALHAMRLHAEQYPHMQRGYTVDAMQSLRRAIAHHNGNYDA